MTRPTHGAYYSGEAMFDLDGYLARIGLSGRPSIAEVHLAHSTTIPFENLDPHRGVEVSLTAEDLADRAPCSTRSRSAPVASTSRPDGTIAWYLTVPNTYCSRRRRMGGRTCTPTCPIPTRQSTSRRSTGGYPRIRSRRS